MRKRAGLARAMALDPEILFFDEPSAGLDPISSRLLDDLILELRDSLGATIVVVTHELASIFAIGNNSVFLDAETKTMIAQGDPRKLRDECPDPRVRNFLLRGGLESAGARGSARAMSKRANPKLIGGFVLGAIALADHRTAGLRRRPVPQADRPHGDVLPGSVGGLASAPRSPSMASRSARSPRRSRSTTPPSRPC